MKQNRSNVRSRAVKAAAVTDLNGALPDLAQLADVATSQVEHRTVLEFLRLIPHKWHPDELSRFGDKVGRMANALQLAFVPATNPSLGVIRAFPVPLMQWVYSMMAAQFGWPLAPLALDDSAREQREELRRHESARKHLEMAAAEHTPPPEIADALGKVMEWLEREAQRLRGDVAPATPPPLRAI